MPAAHSGIVYKYIDIDKSFYFVFQLISIERALKCYYMIYRNLSYGRQNDENKRAIKNAGGITALVRYEHKYVIALLAKHVLRLITICCNHAK